MFFFNSILKGSAKKALYVYYAQSTLHVFSFTALYLPRKAGGAVNSFPFFALSPLVSLQLK